MPINKTAFGQKPFPYKGINSSGPTTQPAKPVSPPAKTYDPKPGPAQSQPSEPNKPVSPPSKAYDPKPTPLPAEPLPTSPQPAPAETAEEQEAPLLDESAASGGQEEEDEQQAEQGANLEPASSSSLAWVGWLAFAGLAGVGIWLLAKDDGK